MEPAGNKLRICLLSPWYGGSHRRWADELCRHSRHRIDILGMPAQHWKWRMHGAAVTLAEQFLSSGIQYDMVLADDMMDVATFSALVKTQGHRIPIATYFHENQLTYPVSPKDTDRVEKRDRHYGFINYTTALASDTLLFNSEYHRNCFTKELPGFLSRFPDYTNPHTVEQIVSRSEVLPLGMDLASLDRLKPEEGVPGERPLLLWNHRWEYDKCPGVFLDLILELHRRELEFDVALLGERGTDSIPQLNDVRRLLGRAVVQDGPVESFSDYGRWLWKGDILPVTAIQDFFGGSVVEAIYCECHPLLPHRLAYPEHVDSMDSLYSGFDDLVDKCCQLIESGDWRNPYHSDRVADYDWSRLIRFYDEAFTRLARSRL